MHGSSPKKKPREPKPPKERKNFWLFIKPKEVGALLGVCERTAHRYLKKAREKAGKLKGEFVTIKDFCSAMGLHQRSLLNHLKRLFRPKRP